MPSTYGRLICQDFYRSILSCTNDRVVDHAPIDLVSSFPELGKWGTS